MLHSSVKCIKASFTVSFADGAILPTVLFDKLIAIIILYCSCCCSSCVIRTRELHPTDSTTVGNALRRYSIQDITKTILPASRTSYVNRVSVMYLDWVGHRSQTTSKYLVVNKDDESAVACSRPHICHHSVAVPVMSTNVLYGLHFLPVPT